MGNEGQIARCSPSYRLGARSVESPVRSCSHSLSAPRIFSAPAVGGPRGLRLVESLTEKCDPERISQIGWQQVRPCEGQDRHVFGHEGISKARSESSCSRSLSDCERRSGTGGRGRSTEGVPWTRQHIAPHSTVLACVLPSS